MRGRWTQRFLPALFILTLAAGAPVRPAAGVDSTDLSAGEEIPTGKVITPLAAQGATFQELNPEHPSAPDVRASLAVSAAVSPDGMLLAVLTGGFNVFFAPDGKTTPELSAQYLFLYDITGGQPKRLQALSLPDSFQGLAWTVASDRLIASTGAADTVVEFVREGRRFKPGRTFSLGHPAGLGVNVTPMAGAVAVSPDGTRLLVANLHNDSVSLVDLKKGRVVAEQDLRPGATDPARHGQPGGSYPRSVIWTSDHRAYVASERDREIVGLTVVGGSIRVICRVPVEGQPVALLANHRGTRLYAALDTTNRVAVLETHRNTLVESFDVTAPEPVFANAHRLGGANPNALALTPNEGTLLVSNGGQNAVAVVRLGARAQDSVEGTGRRAVARDDDEARSPAGSAVIGLVPTGWYPTGVVTSRDGRTWYVVNGKSASGPNVAWCQELDSVSRRCRTAKSAGLKGRVENGLDHLIAENQYVHQLEKAGLLSFPAPEPLELARLTRQVAHNDRFDQPARTVADERLFVFLREHIRHVIYIIKENRSYDQVLGDLERGDGDPKLTLFPERLSPNHHALARQFVTLDHFFLSGEVSWTGWDYAVAGQTTDFREHQEPLAMRAIVLHAKGMPGDNATVRNINIGHPDSASRHQEFAHSPADPDVLPGTRSVYVPDGPDGAEGQGSLWDAALHAGKTVRNWGFYGDQRAAKKLIDPPVVRDPYVEKVQVFFPARPSLMSRSDPYFADTYFGYPDFWRVREWKRELAEFVQRGEAPQLMLVALSNDHFGYFDRAIDGVDTPETQMADNDYALGLLIEAVAQSPLARDTLVISIEDDACDGPDHVDAHRSIALFAGPYVRQQATLSTHYTTLSVVKTIEEILGIGPIGLNDSLAAPMSDLFDPSVTAWSYHAIVPEVLRSTRLPLPIDAGAKVAYPRHPAAYWTQVMAGQDFSGQDRIEPVSFNHALWRGLKGAEPYPGKSVRIE